MSARRRAAVWAPWAVALVLALAAPAGAAPARDFPPGFLWGTAISAFQTEAGGTPANADRNSDWWVWSHDPDEIAAGHVSGDLVERGPGHWARWRQDLRLARERLGANAFRFSIEWSRLFPRPTGAARTPKQLDRLVNERAARHYGAERARCAGLKPVLTLNHFTLPSWLHDPLATRRLRRPRGRRSPARARARRLARPHHDPRVRRVCRLGRPPLRQARGHLGHRQRADGRGRERLRERAGGVRGLVPAGVLSFRAAIQAVRNLAKANALAYDAVHRHDRRARVGPVHNMVAFTPATPSSAGDRRGTRHAEYIFNRVPERGRQGPRRPRRGRPHRGRRAPARRARADFIGLNYYFRSRVLGLGGPASTTVPLFDFLPTNVYAHPQNTGAPRVPRIARSSAGRSSRQGCAARSRSPAAMSRRCT